MTVESTYVPLGVVPSALRPQTCCFSASVARIQVAVNGPARRVSLRLQSETLFEGLSRYAVSR